AASYGWTITLPQDSVKLVVSGQPDSFYNSLGSAFAAIMGETADINLLAMDTTDTWTFAGKDAVISLCGGYDSGFVNAFGTTVLHGWVSIANGTVTMENLTIMP
ncbi:MAG TPA: hypothetical protein VIU40_04630, partial [Geobacteraceae bacterium]